MKTEQQVLFEAKAILFGLLVNKSDSELTLVEAEILEAISRDHQIQEKLNLPKDQAEIDRRLKERNTITKHNSEFPLPPYESYEKE